MWMSPAETQRFRQALEEAECYLEFGAGGSTKAAVQEPKLRKIMAVESDPVFLEKELRSDSDIRTAETAGRLEFVLQDIGPMDEWGTLRDRSRAHTWPDYVLSPFASNEAESFDLVLVDGRFRIACCLAVGLRLPNANLWVHDYNTRPNYWILEDLFQVAESVDSLVRLERAKDFDAARAQSWLDLYTKAPFDEPLGIWHRLRCLTAKVRARLNPK